MHDNVENEMTERKMKYYRSSACQLAFEIGLTGGVVNSQSHDRSLQRLCVRVTVRQSAATLKKCSTWQTAAMHQAHYLLPLLQPLYHRSFAHSLIHSPLRICAAMCWQLRKAVLDTCPTYKDLLNRRKEEEIANKVWNSFKNSAYVRNHRPRCTLPPLTASKWEASANVYIQLWPGWRAKEYGNHDGLAAAGDHDNSS